MQPVEALIGIGSNRRHGRHGAPKDVVRAAVAALATAGLKATRVSRIRPTPPMGPGGRCFANAAVAVETHLTPAALLRLIKGIERDFGRRAGRRWGDRVLDLDLLAMGRLRQRPARGRGPEVPHPGLASRRFVLDPLADIAPGWRHPRLGATVRQLRARLLRGTALRPKGVVRPMAMGP